LLHRAKIVRKRFAPSRQELSISRSGQAIDCELQENPRLSGWKALRLLQTFQLNNKVVAEQKKGRRILADVAPFPQTVMGSH
jgi:hypothetical protein